MLFEPGYAHLEVDSTHAMTGKHCRRFGVFERKSWPTVVPVTVAEHGVSEADDTRTDWRTTRRSMYMGTLQLCWWLHGCTSCSLDPVSVSAYNIAYLKHVCLVVPNKCASYINKYYRKEQKHWWWVQTEIGLINVFTPFFVIDYFCKFNRKHYYYYYSPRCPDRFWGPPSLLASGYRG
jgi:hypothetical protein